MVSKLAMAAALCCSEYKQSEEPMYFIFESITSKG